MFTRAYLYHIHVSLYMYVIQVIHVIHVCDTRCNYVYTRAYLYRTKCTHTHIVEQGGVTNDDVI